MVLEVIYDFDLNIVSNASVNYVFNLLSGVFPVIAL